MQSFNDLDVEDFQKHCGKKKMLVTSICSFWHYFFLPIWKTNSVVWAPLALYHTISTFNDPVEEGF